jgi:hypothetical protein
MALKRLKMFCAPFLSRFQNGSTYCVLKSWFELFWTKTALIISHFGKKKNGSNRFEPFWTKTTLNNWSRFKEPKTALIFLKKKIH